MKECRLKDICIKGSSNLKQKDVEGKKGLYPVYGASGKISSIDIYHQENEYIAIVKDGSGIGRVSFMPPKSSVIGTMQYILPKEGYNIRYIGYCLQSLGLNKYKQGAAIPHIYFRDYGERIVKVSEDIDEQRRIVSYLDSSFKLIDEIKEKAQKSLSEAKALFQSALAEAMEPKEGWEEKTLGDVCNVVTDFVAAGSFADLRKNVIYNNNPDYAQLVRTTDLKSNFSKNGMVYVSESAFKYLYRVNMNRECIILPNVGINCGEVYYVNPNMLPYKNNVLGPNAIFVRSEKAINKFLSYSFRFNAFQKQLYGITSHMAQPKFNKTSLKTLTISLPPLSTQKRIVSHLDKLSSNVKQMEEKYKKMVEECDALKQAMLRDVFE